MGLISAAIGSAATGLGDTFKEVVTCPEIGNNVIIQRGVVNHGSGNMVYSEGVISAGSKIIVPQGMAMMIVDNGAIVEFTDTPGDYIWDSSSEPSIFVGNLGKSIVNTIKTIGNRITYGGQAAKDQRVYYVNTKILPAIPYGSQQPETIVDPVYGSVEVTYNGEFNIKVDDPVILVNTMLGANPKDTLTFDEIFATDGRNILKGRFAQKVGEAITEIMAVNNVSFNRIQGQRSAITDKMNTLLNADWHDKYGIVVAGEVTININASEEARTQIREIDRVRGMAQADAERVGVMSDAYSKNLQGAMAAATGEAMLNASNNDGGSMAGFMGMGFAQNAGANIAGAINNLPNGASNQANMAQTDSQTSSRFCANCGASASVSAKFCTQCGQPLN
jgi:membrane protease subunit (stomatin/prohibitin family)